ncbi:hypothetical protein CcaCcLH18_14033 [Colletotrichum camelliae]|nr:hypothetical protein CcaCcLH18_14033 [Colletotrichum camelliae]
MLFTTVTSLVVGFAATLASAAPPNAAHAASDISDSCDTATSDKKCCFALTVKQDSGNGKVQDWGYVRASKTGQIFVGFDINAYPHGFFCFVGNPTFQGTDGIYDSIGNFCDFSPRHDGIFSCSGMGPPNFGTAKTKLSDGSEILLLTLDKVDSFGICPLDAKKSLFYLVNIAKFPTDGCHTINLALDPKTPDTCPK